MPLGDHASGFDKRRARDQAVAHQCQSSATGCVGVGSGLLESKSAQEPEALNHYRLGESVSGADISLNDLSLQAYEMAFATGSHEFRFIFCIAALNTTV